MVTLIDLFILGILFYNFCRDIIILYSVFKKKKISVFTKLVYLSLQPIVEPYGGCIAESFEFSSLRLFNTTN